MTNADPDDVLNLFKYDKHIQFAEKLGFISSDVAALPVESVLALYPEVKKYGIRFWMTESLTPALEHRVLQARYLGKLNSGLRALSWEAYHKATIMSREQELDSSHPLRILSYVLLYTSDFHDHLGVRYYSPSIEREDYDKLLGIIPEHMKSVLPDWLLGRNW